MPGRMLSGRYRVPRDKIVPVDGHRLRRPGSWSYCVAIKMMLPQYANDPSLPASSRRHKPQRQSVSIYDWGRRNHGVSARYNLKLSQTWNDSRKVSECQIAQALSCSTPSRHHSPGITSWVWSADSTSRSWTLALLVQEAAV